MRAVPNVFNNWCPQPELHLYIQSAVGSFAFTDGSFKATYCARQLLSKYADPDPALSESRVAAAFTKLLATENRNRTTNRRLSEMRLHQGEIHMARMIIQDVLGEFNIEELYRLADFSNGASQSRLRKEANKFSKFNGSSHVTNSAMPYLVSLYKASPSLRRLFVTQQLFNNTEVAFHNELFTVPKSDSIDRICAKEPDWNMYFQKGLGTMIRRRLKDAGIDLNDQSINRDLARVGSITNKLATLDLSSASDSITTELVYQLLPRDWFEHLDRLRSPLGKFPDGRIHKWNLFSTMGNGYTFELESLIFYALSRACCYTFGRKGRISVYGDDIIVPSTVVPQLRVLLEYCGFIVNEDKSFSEGPFRESCGGHYYNGQDVTPFYIKSPIREVEDLVLILNKLRKWASQDMLHPSTGEPIVCDPRLSELFRWLESHIVDSHLIKGGPIELSGRYISGPGEAKYHIKQVSRKKRARQLEAYAYWLTKRSRTVLNTDVSITGKTKLVRNRNRSNGSAPFFEHEGCGEPLKLIG